MGRTCDNCGIKLPMFVPRKRAEDGRLLCDGCHPDGKGSEGRPIGLHGSRKVRDTYERLYGTQEAPGLACEACSAPMGDNGLIMEAGLLVCPEGCPHTADLTPPPGKKVCGRCAGRGRITGAGGSHRCVACGGSKFVEKTGATTVSEPPKRKVTQPESEEPVVDKTRALNDYIRRAKELRNSNPYKGDLRAVAHDSGDGATIYHCPFCGSGQVTGGADGTVECDFCKSYFTVQVQPERMAMPQTVNGQPQQMPGMPGDGSQPAPFGGANTDAPPFEPPMQEAMDTALQGVPAFAPPQPAGGQPVTSSKTAAVEWTTYSTFSGGGIFRAVINGRNMEVRSQENGYYWLVYDKDKPLPAWGGSESPIGPPYNSRAEAEAAAESYASRFTAKRRFFLTADGLLPEESYIHHLAIKHADDRDAVLDQVRAERG